MIRVKRSTPPLAVALLQLCVAFVIGNDSENGSTSAMDGSIDDTSNSFEGAAELLSSAKDIRVGAAIVAAIAILGGGVICLAGYRLFRPTVFFCAFMVGGFFIAGIIETAFASMTWMPTASWIGFGVGGVIAGVVVLMLYSASIFMAGAVGGIMLAFTINTSVGTRIYPNNPGIIFILLAVLLGILGGLLALKLERPVLIVTTAIVGSTTCIAGLGYFIGDYPNGADLKEFGFKNMKGDWVYDLPDAWWGYLAAMIVLFLVGLTVQLRKTAWGYDHSGNRGSQGLSKGNANV